MVRGEKSSEMSPEDEKPKIYFSTLIMVTYRGVSLYSLHKDVSHFVTTQVPSEQSSTACS